MTNKIIIDAVKVIDQLHKKVIEIISKKNSKVKNISILNSVIDPNTDKLDISIDLKNEKMNSSEYIKIIEEYIKLMFGEEISKQIKSSDINVDKNNKNIIHLKIEDSIVNNKNSEDNSINSDNFKENNKKKRKKRFNLIDEFVAQIKDGINVLRSIEIKTQYSDKPIKIGKILFGTTHDTEDTKNKLGESFRKEFPNNRIVFNIVNSKSLLYTLFEKELDKDVKGKHWLYENKDKTIKRYLETSKYSLQVKVQDDDPNFEQIDEETIRDFLKKSIGFKPDKNGVKLIEGYIEEGMSSNADKSDLSSTDRKVYDLKNKFNKKWDEINTKYKDFDIKKKEWEDLIKDYKEYFKEPFINLDSVGNKEPDKKDKKSHDEWQKRYDEWCEEKGIDKLFDKQSGAKAPKGDLNMFFIPLTTKGIVNNILLKKLRHNFDDLGGKSTSDKDYGINII